MAILPNKTYQGDCTGKLNEIDPESVDLVTVLLNVRLRQVHAVLREVLHVRVSYMFLCSHRDRLPIHQTEVARLMTSTTLGRAPIFAVDTARRLYVKPCCPPRPFTKAPLL